VPLRDAQLMNSRWNIVDGCVEFSGVVHGATKQSTNAPVKCFLKIYLPSACKAYNEMCLLKVPHD
jgi:hypothetical protein